jgi:hypothetical protein
MLTNAHLEKRVDTMTRFAVARLLSGCNWSEDLVLNYGTSKSEAVLQHLRPLHREARRRFNVGGP